MEIPKNLQEKAVGRQKYLYKGNFSMQIIWLIIKSSIRSIDLRMGSNNWWY